MIVIDIFRHLELALIAGDQSSFAVATSLLCAHPVLALVALLGANVAESIVEDLRRTSLASHESVLLLVAVLSRWEYGPVNLLAAGA